MERNLLKIFKLADLLNDKQDMVYAQIEYTANNRKCLEIAIRSKSDYSFIEKCEVNLSEKSSLRWKGIIKLFESYVGGVGNE